MTAHLTLAYSMYCHNILITVFGFAKGSWGGAADGCRTGDAVEKCISLAREIAKLMNLYRVLWGIDIFPASHI